MYGKGFRQHQAHGLLSRSAALLCLVLAACLPACRRDSAGDTQDRPLTMSQDSLGPGLQTGPPGLQAEPPGLQAEPPDSPATGQAVRMQPSRPASPSLARGSKLSGADRHLGIRPYARLAAQDFQLGSLLAVPEPQTDWMAVLDAARAELEAGRLPGHHLGPGLQLVYDRLYAAALRAAPPILEVRYAQPLLQPDGYLLVPCRLVFASGYAPAQLLLGQQGGAWELLHLSMNLDTLEAPSAAGSFDPHGVLR